MEESSVHVPVANIRKKVLNYSISVMLTIAIITTGILIYDKVQEQELSTVERQRTSGLIHASLSSNGSVTIGTQMTGLTDPTTLSDINDTSVRTLESTSDEITSETETTSSHVSTPLTSGISFSTTVQMNSSISTSTCQPNVSNKTATARNPTDCSGYDIALGLNDVHTIYLNDSSNETVLAYCMSTCDGIWTVIQKRFDGSVDFYRNWTEYKEGFGDASGEYWLGNDVVHQLTSRSSYKLKIILKDWDNVTAYVIYDIFHISNESDGYRLTIGGYHGNAGDSLHRHNGEKFSTLDRDNASTGGSCATLYTGAWWYHRCFESNLNGRYFHEAGTFNSGGITWGSFYAGLPVKETAMMIQNI